MDDVCSLPNMNCLKRNDLENNQNDANKKSTEIISDAKYKPHFQRLEDANKNYLYSSVRVRVYSGDAEKDIVLKIRNQDLQVKDICAALEKLLQIPTKYGTIFQLWVFGKDLELQLDPEQNITELLLKWHIV